MTDPETQSEEQLRAFVKRTRDNEAKMQRFQALELNLMGSHTFPELMRQLIDDYRTAFSLEYVTLALVDPSHEIRRLLEDEEIDQEYSRHLRLLIEKRDRKRLDALGDEPALHAFDREQHGWLFPSAALAPASIAIMPLERRGQTLGCLNFGSLAPDRFDNGIGKTFLKRLSAVVGICVENTLNVERLRTAGLTDPLTGIRNRRFLDERLFEEMARAIRSNQPLSFLFLDIDHFKRVNDVHGHHVGDLVLRSVADRIAGSLRATDVLTRYGGEEFAVLQPGTDIPVALLVAERIRLAIADEPVRVDGGVELPVTISIGVAAITGGTPGVAAAVQAKSLATRADAALLEAKNTGRNRVASAPN